MTFRRVPFQDDRWLIGEGEVAHFCSRNEFQITKVHVLDEGVRCCDRCEEPIPEKAWFPALMFAMNAIPTG